MTQHFRLQEREQSGSFTGEIVVSTEDFLIGRGTDCDLRLFDDAVSRHHCSIRTGNDETLLLDLGSANGTYLNGKRIRSQAPLQSGDEITIGAHVFIVQFSAGDVQSPTLTRFDPATSTRLVPKKKSDD